MTELDDLADQFEKHEKDDARRFEELASLVRSEVGKVISAISGSETAEGLRGKIYAIEKLVPDNARERLRTLEQLVPSDLPIALNALKTAEERRVIAMRLLWSSVAGLGVTVAGMILSKLLQHPGLTP